MIQFDIRLIVVLLMANILVWSLQFCVNQLIRKRSRAQQMPALSLSEA
jgi:hypothetical protein